ncbi:MAG: hypothetical protein JRJ87_12890 [Deltaproteobacteria bacterium]|nr:hypothetical protein [Deltaproteobacteria bacterium]
MYKIVVLLLVGLVASCGGGQTDISGMYQTVQHTKNEGDCTNQGNDESEPPYFLLTKQDFFGATLYSMSNCTSTAEVDCAGGGLFGLTFSIPVSNGWEGESSMSFGDGDPCNLAYSETSAILDGETLTVEARTWGEEVTLTEEKCNPDEARARGEGMPCETYEVFRGNRIE